MPRSLAFIFCVLFSFNASANFQMDMLKAKNTNKVNSRWTLADWLAQKNKMALADQWLALHRSANLFDVMVSGGVGDFKIKSTNKTGKDQSYRLDAYLSIFNLYGEYEKRDDDIESYGGAVGLRLFGTSSQTTNLTLRYGLRHLSNFATHENWDNPFAEGQLQIYLIQYLGIQGKYRHYFPDESNLGNKLQGHRVTAGAFLEALIFRLYADYYQEPMELTSAGAVSKESRTGMEYGLKLFF